MPYSTSDTKVKPDSTLFDFHIFPYYFQEHFFNIIVTLPGT